jgi:hypothetical protein
VHSDVHTLVFARARARTTGQTRFISQLQLLLYAELMNASKTPSDGIRTCGMSKNKGKDGPKTPTDNVGVLTTPFKTVHADKACQKTSLNPATSTACICQALVFKANHRKNLEVPSISLEMPPAVASLWAAPSADRISHRCRTVPVVCRSFSP